MAWFTNTELRGVESPADLDDSWLLGRESLLSRCHRSALLDNSRSCCLEEPGLEYMPMAVLVAGVCCFA